MMRWKYPRDKTTHKFANLVIGRFQMECAVFTKPVHFATRWELVNCDKCLARRTETADERKLEDFSQANAQKG